MKNNRLFLFCLLVFLGISSLSAQKTYKYETVPNDPLQARIYTLDNGLKVFLTVYKEEPRIQCNIPVKVGSKNDPAETTGLAHYFEHMMFKGSTNFGTTNWAKEKPMIDEIERLFELYRKETDQVKRAAIYHIIDSISYEASKIAIPNEYDKLMSAIGSTGTNAGTSFDYTVYFENIPSNQLENWAMIQADRFTQPVLRLFHTELETIYEEKNMSLTNDGRRSSEAMLTGLYQNHPYGLQTTLGTQEHLRNPSMTNINAFFKQYYVANNMAICLSGDFEYDEAIRIIDKYFGHLPSRPVPALNVAPEKPITAPIVKEVIGLEAENVIIAFRIDEPANSKEITVLRMFDYIVDNGKAGLINLNLNQKQLVFRASAGPFVLADNSAYTLGGSPKTGQTLDEVKDLLLEQIELVKQGKFDDWLLEAGINNLRLNEMRQLENNRARASMLSNAFQNNIPWNEAAVSIDSYAKITKADIVKFANKHFKSNNYVIVYKRQGTPNDIAKVEKPSITPIEINRDAESDFLKKVKANKPTPLQPVFVDFNQAITFDYYNGCPIYYVQNKENKTFSLVFRFSAGELNNLRFPIAMDYVDYLGTATTSPEKIKELFYQYACNLGTGSSDEYSNISISGLNDNFEAALTLSMDLLKNAQPNEEALQNMVRDYLKGRTDAKSRQASVSSALAMYGMYGPEMAKYALTEAELQALKGSELIALLKELMTYKPEIIYYGPESVATLKTMLAKVYQTPKTFGQPQPKREFEMKPVATNSVLFTHYEAKQARLTTYNRSIKYDKSLIPVISMYNEYFGGSMNSIVFQEMREKRSLAYSAGARYVTPTKQENFMYNYSSIATQNDKIVDAFTAFNELFDDMPLSEAAFNLAKDALKTNIEATRITKTGIINTYLRNRRLGIDYDLRKDIYNATNTITMDDIVKFSKQYVAKQPKTYLILSNEKEVNFDDVEKSFGKVTKLTLEDIFGY